MVPIGFILDFADNYRLPQKDSPIWQFNLLYWWRPAIPNLLGLPGGERVTTPPISTDQFF
jgi:hypothetical protein